MNFNEKLISLRKSKGLSQEELGAQLKVSRQTISKWESAQSYPDFQRLVLLSDYFGLTLDELVKGSGKKAGGDRFSAFSLPKIKNFPSFFRINT